MTKNLLKYLGIVIKKNWHKALWKAKKLLGKASYDGELAPEYDEKHWTEDSTVEVRRFHDS